MMNEMIAASIAAALASTMSMASGALAQTSPPTAAPAAKASADPNRKICQKFEEIGSRLGTVRVCLTAQQWEDRRRDQRNDVERAQRNVGIKPVG